MRIADIGERSQCHLWLVTFGSNQTALFRPRAKLNGAGAVPCPAILSRTVPVCNPRDEGVRGATRKKRPLQPGVGSNR